MNPPRLIRPVPVLDTDFRASRRLFLRQAGALGLVAGAGAPLALNLMAASHAAAADASDYRALVCIFLFGGNDSYNTVLATDPTSWAAYTAVRHQTPDSLALMAAGTPPSALAAPGSPARLGGVLPLSPLTPDTHPGRSFALHPLLGRMAPLFNTERRLAVLANVGPLLQPTTKLQHYTPTHPRPAALFSHNDQQSTWQSLGPEGTTVGWGGRIGDLLAAGNTRATFTTVSASGNAVFLSGQSVRQYQIGSTGTIRLGADARGETFGSAAVTAALERVASRARGSHVLERDLAEVTARSIDTEALLRDALRPASEAPFGTPPGPAGVYSPVADPLLSHVNPIDGTTVLNPLAQQLQAVARMIDAGRRGTSGVRRQVFFVSLGGFDTHDSQNRNHTQLLARLDHAIGYFDGVLGALGAQDNVTTFTASDFGRTFTSNGDGTDHGWGAHHVVLGGAVRGGQVFGRFPVLAMKNADNPGFDGSPDQLGNGILLPTTSVDQFGATLARWMGLSASQALELFPNLANWNSGVRDLGFLRA